MSEAARHADRGLPAGFEWLGPGRDRSDEIFAVVGRGRFFSDFGVDDVSDLADYMNVYAAAPGTPLIREGDTGDFMVFVLSGRVDILKRDAHGADQHMTYAGPGAVLGEMSMIDGEPRFASCVAIDRVNLAVLTRDDMGRLLVERPGLGAKILVKLVTMLSQRLRQASAELVKRRGR